MESDFLLTQKKDNKNQNNISAKTNNKHRQKIQNDSLKYNTIKSKKPKYFSYFPIHSEEAKNTGHTIYLVTDYDYNEDYKNENENENNKSSVDENDKHIIYISDKENNDEKEKTIEKIKTKKKNLIKTDIKTDRKKKLTISMKDTLNSFNSPITKRIKEGAKILYKVKGNKKIYKKKDKNEIDKYGIINNNNLYNLKINESIINKVKKLKTEDLKSKIDLNDINNSLEKNFLSKDNLFNKSNESSYDFFHNKAINDVNTSKIMDKGFIAGLKNEERKKALRNAINTYNTIKSFYTIMNVKNENKKKNKKKYIIKNNFYNYDNKKLKKYQNTNSISFSKNKGLTKNIFSNKVNQNSNSNTIEINNNVNQQKKDLKIKIKSYLKNGNHSFFTTRFSKKNTNNNSNNNENQYKNSNNKNNHKRFNEHISNLKTNVRTQRNKIRFLKSNNKSISNTFKYNSLIKDFDNNLLLNRINNINKTKMFINDCKGYKTDERKGNNIKLNINDNKSSIPLLMKKYEINNTYKAIQNNKLDSENCNCNNINNYNQKEIRRYNCYKTEVNMNKKIGAKLKFRKNHILLEVKTNNKK